jgi:hypothetical protein
MKKLFAIAIAVSMLSGLYGLSFGIGGAYENLAGPEGTDPYFAVKGDVAFNILPILGCRLGLIDASFPEGVTSIRVGTRFAPDLLVYIPVPAPVNPYALLGIGFNMFNYDDPIPDVTAFDLKGGLGAQMFFMPNLGFYLEGGVNFYYLKVGDADATTENPLYIQGGLRVPIKL